MRGASHSTSRRLRAVLGAIFVAGMLVWTSCAGVDGPMPVTGGAPVAFPSTFGADAVDGGSEHTTVLVALDGVRWQEVFEGVEPERARDEGMSEREIVSARVLVPNLHALMDAGAALNGERFSASGPEFISLPGYQEMLTGRRDTGCTTNDCGHVRFPTLADDFAARSGVSPLEVAVIASWPGIEPAAARNPWRLTISVGRRGGVTKDLLRFDDFAVELLEAGARAAPAPGGGDYRPDQSTAAIALHYLRTQRPRFLFLSLGDTDEYGHRNDYRGYLRALSHADWVVGHIAAILAGHRREGRRATLLVTTDHGRSHDFAGHGASAPESARAWLVAAGWGIEARGLVTPPVPRRLADVAATIRTITGVGQVRKHGAPLAELMLPEPDGAFALVR